MSSEKIHTKPIRLFEFGPFTLEGEERRLLKDGEPVTLTAKVFDLLLLLVESPGSLRSRNDLIDALWPDTVVEEHSLTSRISALRKALGDEDDPPRYIETVRGQGYRFVADVTPRQVEPPAPQESSPRGKSRTRMYIAAGLAACTLLAAGGILIWHFGNGSVDKHIPDKSIAVLPFENLSTDKNNGYFAEGIQDMILTKLADIGGLKVISRTSADLYKSHPKDLRTIARELGVADVLEGSVQKSGDEVLVNVQLIDARSDRHIWAKAYTRTLSDIFNVESDVSQRVADQLKLELVPAVAKRIQTAPTQNPEAYDSYLKADHFLAQFFATGKEEAIDTAIEEYRKAIGYDPQFALAYAQLSYALIATYYYLHHHTDVRLKQATDAADRSVALNPDLAQAHGAKGYVYYWGQQDYPAALHEFKKALALKPQDAFMRLSVGSVYRRQGRWKEAVHEITRAVSLDPRNVFILRNLALSYSALRRYKEALEIDKRILSINPDATVDIANMAYVYDYMGRVEKALATLDAIPDNLKNNQYILYARYQSLMLAHDFNKACAVTKQMQAGGQFATWTILSLRAEALPFCGQRAEARSDTRKLITQLKAALKKTPGNAMMHDTLGIAYAIAGMPEEGIRQGKRAVELFPMSKDAFFATGYLSTLAQIYAKAGRPEKAVAIFRKLLQIPAGNDICIAILERDPTLNRIRNSPEFQKLLKTKFKINMNPI